MLDAEALQLPEFAPRDFARHQHERSICGQMRDCERLAVPFGRERLVLDETDEGFEEGGGEGAAYRNRCCNAVDHVYLLSLEVWLDG